MNGSPGSEKPKKRYSLSLKMNLLIVSAILMVTGGLMLISYMVYSKSIKDYFLLQSENAAQAAKEAIIPDMVAHLWDEINTDEFRRIREEAIAANDEKIIINWMRSRPSFKKLLGTEDFLVDMDSYEDVIDSKQIAEQENLFYDFQMMIYALNECQLLFDISDVYIQYDEDKITYNLVDPDEKLFYIGSIETQIDVFMDYDNNEYFPPTIYHSEFGWLATTLLPLDETMDGEIHGYIGVDTDMNEVVRRQLMFLVNSGIYVLVLTGAAVMISMFLMHWTTVSPLQQLSQAAAEFAKNDKELTKEDVIQLPIRSNDEIGDLYHQIQDMQARIIDYTENLTKITTERERGNAELQMARNIQRSMLPEKFPAFPDRSEFDLFALMIPARVVGGDFYDFFMPDDEHLAVLIADVSDKSVPAALFMMSSKILINYRARQGGTPAEILTDVNVQLCRDNSSKMFVTVWMGILDLTTGVMICANAGHEYPFFRDKDGAFHVLRDVHGLVIGALSKTKYYDYEVKLEPGDAVFVYTDGVPEANDPDGQIFGMKRLEAALNRVSGENPKTILEQIKADVESYANGTDQFDDLTMLCLEYKRPYIPHPESRQEN